MHRLPEAQPMDLEAQCLCRWGNRVAEVTALLESHGLTLRGDLRRTIPLAAMKGIRVDGEALCFRTKGEAVSLALGARRARHWAASLAGPPPTLAQKLGISPAAKALVIGRVADPALMEALRGATAARVDEARATLAVVSDAEALRIALLIHAALPPSTPIWVVHGKGGQATFGESAARHVMRAAGYAGNRISAVSDMLSATRYAKRRDGS